MPDSDSDAERRTTSSNTRARSGVERDTESDATADRWSTDAPVLEAELPRDVRVRLGRLLGEASVDTLGDWVAEVRRRTGGESIAVDDLCRSDEATAHRGETDGETYHFRCFYDAIVLAALIDGSVDVRTESPDGAVIEARAVGTADLTVSPEEAVFSFGVDERVTPPSNEEPSRADVYAAICPYVRAFPHREAYERWAETVPAATVGLPLAGATDVAAALVA